MTNLVYKDGGDVPQGVGLLISILLRYPEVGTIRYYQDRHALQYTFLTGVDEKVIKLEDSLPEALALFHQLEEEEMRICTVSYCKEEEVGRITIVRDVESMTQKEVGLMVELVKRACGKELIYEDVVLGEEEQLFQEEVIGHMLANLQKSQMDKNVIAVREEGRVLVFNN